MFFILSKTIAFLLLPSNFLFAIALIGLALLLTRWRRAGVMLMAISLVLMALGGFLPVGRILNHTLESRFPPWDPSRGAPDGIIVLGGAISPVLSRIYGATQLGGNAERVTVIAKLARDYPKARIVYSGGDASLFGDAGREADYLYPLLNSFGVPRDRVLLEARARNTLRERHFDQGTGQAQGGRALAFGDVGATHAARHRLLPARRLPGRSLSGRLAYPANT